MLLFPLRRLVKLNRGTRFQLDVVALLESSHRVRRDSGVCGVNEAQREGNNAPEFGSIYGQASLPRLGRLD